MYSRAQMSEMKRAAGERSVKNQLFRMEGACKDIRINGFSYKRFLELQKTYAELMRSANRTRVLKV